MTQREQMEAVIRSGGGVLYGGRIITRLEHLPSEDELAKNDATARMGRRARLQAEVDRLQEEIERLTVGERPEGLPATGAAADEPPTGHPQTQADSRRGKGKEKSPEDASPSEGQGA